MRKEIIGTNIEDVKVWGIPFKKNTIRKIVIHDEKHTFTYQDSLSGALRCYDAQIQQIDVYTDKDNFSISAPQWGYTEFDSKERIKHQKQNFKTACEELLAKIKK